MITVRDKSLGKYSITEDFQGFKVNDETGRSLVKTNTFEEALRYIANRLVLDTPSVYNLAQYTQRKKEVFEAIVAAQGDGEQPMHVPDEQGVIDFSQEAQ